MSASVQRGDFKDDSPSVSPKNSRENYQSNRNKTLGAAQRASSQMLVVTERPSLNYAARKRETERIERENHVIAKRLFSNCATIRKQDQDDSYAVMSEIKKRIKRHKRRLDPIQPTA